MLRLHDTALGKVVDVVPRRDGELSLYVCGPTVDNLPHVGHGRSVLVYDVLRRYLEWSGVGVHHVSNVTDIDDKIVKRAAEERRSASEVAAQYEAEWWRAMDALGALRPSAVPHATAYVEQMVEAIAQMVASGAAYVTGDGVYLDVGRIEGYGLLAHQPLSSLRAGARIGQREDKRDPADFALWKATGEPSWSSPWMRGRPGWHTECVVMSLDLLGEGFDLHTGAFDLEFPHHENERAQAIALGRPFARHWMHHAFVESAGEKMSKSLGNYTSLADLLARTDPRAYRLLVLQSHYRKPMEVDEAALARAGEALGRLDALARRFEGAGVPARPGALDEFRRRMEDDLDTPGALAQLFDLVRRANALADSGDAAGGASLAAAAREAALALGLALRSVADEADPATAELVARRDRARAARDFAAADAIRDQLVAAGWVVEDSPQGTKVRRRGAPAG